MKIFTEAVNSLTPSIITIGVFDGVHIGHQDILMELVKKGDDKKYEKIVFTFKNHPLSILKPSVSPSLLTTFEEKIEALSTFSIDRLIVLDFTKSFSQYSAEEFIKDMLIERLNMKELLVGYDFAFGRNRGGDVENLLKFGELMNFSLKVISPRYSGNEVVSSSLIRRYLGEGNVKGAAKLLGRPYHLSGEVVRGEKIGRKYGFPTANLSVNAKKILPLNGVYAVWVFYKGNRFPGIVNVGNKPTIGEYVLSVEVNIFDFNQSIYGETLKIEFIDMIREERKFANKEELYLQVEKDIIFCRETLFGLE